MSIVGAEWIQAGELGLAFIVVVLCAGLITFVMKSSARREEELMKIISRVLPLMESISSGMDTFNLSMTSVANRLEKIEEGQIVFMTKNECKILDSMADGLKTSMASRITKTDVPME